MTQSRNLRRKTLSPRVRPQRVLVVDDDPVIRDMMADILECEGYVPELARDGHEALRLLQGPQSYLVFLDFMMPAFNGREVCEHLGAYPQTRQRHVIILMSAMDRIDETTDLDIDMLMPKPFIVNDVAEALDMYME